MLTGILFVACLGFSLQYVWVNKKCRIVFIWGMAYPPSESMEPTEIPLPPQPSTHFLALALPRGQGLWGCCH